MSNGWICIHRKIRESEIWDYDEPFTRRDAWIDLLLLANHNDKTILFDGKRVTVKRGQYLTSVRKLAQEWHWGNAKTLAYLRILEECGMITRNANSRRTLITIVNYSIYQDNNIEEANSVRTLTDTVSERRPTTNNNINNDNNNNNIYIVEQEDKIVTVKEIIEYLNEKTGKNFKPGTEKTKRCINARLNEGFTIEDFKTVIDIKCKKWLEDEKMRDYLRPETLFGTKFESYLNEAPKAQEKKEKSLSELTEEEWKDYYNQGKVTTEDYYKYHA